MTRSRRFSLFTVITAVVLFSLGLLNLVINRTSVGSWLPLLVLMPLPFVQGLRQLRAHQAADRRGPVL